jgi:hypothetical protein
MSEHQTYEFLALDRPLSLKEQAALRAISSRAEISATRFFNEYDWGDLKVDPADLMRDYFDAHLYTANWGTVRLMLRLPRGMIQLKEARRYCAGHLTRAFQTKIHLVLDIHAEVEGEDLWDAPPLGTLARLRDELMKGDFRPLYLAWLLGAQEDESKLRLAAPDAPPGLAKLSGPQREFADLFHVSRDLLREAAGRSPKTPEAVRTKKDSKPGKPFEGSWRIESASGFDDDDLGMLGPPFLSFKGAGGSFQLLAVQGELDCRYGKRDEVPCVEWTWAGDDDGTESSGRGFATLSLEGALEGSFFFHLGDELAFRAVRTPSLAAAGTRRRRRAPLR